MTFTTSVPGVIHCDSLAANAAWATWAAADQAAPGSAGPRPQPLANNFGLDPKGYWTTGCWWLIPGFQLDVPVPIAPRTGWGILDVSTTGRYVGTRCGELGLLGTVHAAGGDAYFDFGLWEIDLGVAANLRRVIEWCSLPWPITINAWARQVIGKAAAGKPAYDYYDSALPDLGAPGSFDLLDMQAEVYLVPGGSVKTPNDGDGTFVATSGGVLYAEVIV